MCVKFRFVILRVRSNDLKPKKNVQWDLATWISNNLVIQRHQLEICIVGRGDINFKWSLAGWLCRYLVRNKTRLFDQFSSNWCRCMCCWRLQRHTKLWVYQIEMGYVVFVFQGPIIPWSLPVLQEHTTSWTLLVWLLWGMPMSRWQVGFFWVSLILLLFREHTIWWILFAWLLWVHWRVDVSSSDYVFSDLDVGQCRPCSLPLQAITSSKQLELMPLFLLVSAGLARPPLQAITLSNDCSTCHQW